MRGERRTPRDRIARSAFRHRQSAGAGFLVRQAFSRASGALPVRRVAESAHVLAFRHPVPGFEPVHILLVPKFAAPSLPRLTNAQRTRLATEVELLVGESLERLGLSGTGFIVLVNGGPRQDVGQVHFHLLTRGYDLAPAPAELEPATWTHVPDPGNEIHQIFAGDQAFLAGLERAVEMNKLLELERRGYSVGWDRRANQPRSVVHVTAGSRP